jgi:hypothetical protein
MTNSEPNADQPLDDHLQEDIAAPSDTNAEGSNLTPGQTNAGQQVGGLASATQDPKGEEPPGTENNGNNPV